MTLAEKTATSSDLSFMYSCMLYGAKKGHYSFNPENPKIVKWMRQEMQSVVIENRLIDKRRASAFVYRLSNKRVALLILCEAAINADSYELYALSVSKKYQGLGYGGQIIDGLLEQFPNIDIYARCSPASEKMANLLLRRNFIFYSFDGPYKILKHSAETGILPYNNPAIHGNNEAIDIR